MDDVERYLDGLRMMDSVYDFEENPRVKLSYNEAEAELWNEVRNEDYGTELMDLVRGGRLDEAYEFLQGEIDE